MNSSRAIWSSAGTVLGSDLSSAMASVVNGLFDSSTPVCGAGIKKDSNHLKLGQACLDVENKDSSLGLELWAQSVECYKCPPWPYLSLAPGMSGTLVVNTTYPTNLYIKNETQADFYHMTYHFGEYGSYYLSLGATNASSLYITRQPDKEYVALIMAVVFYVMLAFMWQCAKLLRRRMDAAPSHHTPTHIVEAERTPLLSALQSESQPSVASGDPQPSTSSASHLHPADSASTSSAHTPQSSSSQPAVLDNSNSDPAQVSSPTSSQGVIPDTRKESGRLRSLDAFRGLAIVLMIFVNYGGGKYYFFAHARWNGLTVADLVFPWFLWIMGTSLVFSVRSQLRRATRRLVIVLRILKRSVTLFALGIIVNSTNGNNYMPTFRILGVLQRFAICYLLAAVIEVYCMNPQESPEYVRYWVVRDVARSAAQWGLTIILIAVHTTITFALPVPGCPRGYLGPGGLHEGGHFSNCTGGAAGYIDKVVFGSAHVYSHPTSAVIYNSDTPYDPEGLLGALTSVLMVQFGAACGRIILTFHSHKGRIFRWVVWAGITGLLATCLCFGRKEGGAIPVNKNLWSLSFVCCTACFAFILFSVFYFIIDQKKWWSGNPLRYTGMNSILLYVGHEICGGLFPWSWKPVGQHHANYLIMNLWGMSIWICVAYVLHRKKLYLSV